MLNGNVINFLNLYEIWIFLVSIMEDWISNELISGFEERLIKLYKIK